LQVATGAAVTGLTKKIIGFLKGEKEKTGTTVSGKTSSALEELLKKRGYTVSIQDDEIQVLKVDGSNEDEIALITPATGLIGAPVKVDKGIEFEALIQAGKMRPGARVKIEAADLNRINAEITIKTISFRGDTHGGEWTAGVYGE
jgi:hypothetical protein